MSPHTHTKKKERRRRGGRFGYGGVSLAIDQRIEEERFAVQRQQMEPVDDPRRHRRLRLRRPAGSRRLLGRRDTQSSVKAIRYARSSQVKRLRPNRTTTRNKIRFVSRRIVPYDFFWKKNPIHALECRLKPMPVKNQTGSFVLNKMFTISWRKKYRLKQKRISWNSDIETRSMTIQCSLFIEWLFV